jgi:hypothetical protein
MRRAIGIALVVAIALVFLNDAGRWVNSQSRLNESTAQLAEWAATNLAGKSRDAAAQIVSAEGTKYGMQVYQYDQDQSTVRIWSAVDVPGTWVIGPYVAITKGTPVDQSLGAPFVVRSYQQAQFQ